MNKILAAGILITTINYGCFMQKEVTKESISEPIATVGYVKNKICKDNPIGEYPIDQKLLEINIFIDEVRYSFIENNPILYEKVKKEDLVNVIYLEKYEAIVKGKKTLEQKIIDIGIFGAGPRISEPGDSIIIQKFKYKIF